MHNLAIIPARSGSKRIKNKNIKLFLNKPIIAYSIETAFGSGLFDKIMVSTDSEKIAVVAKKYGADVPFYRSNKSSNDYAPLNDVVKEVIYEYKKRGEIFDYACLILPTAPLITIKNLKKGLEILRNSNFNSVRPIVKFGFPIQRAFKLLSNNEVIPAFPEEFPKRSQDLEPRFHDSGQFYWFKGDKNISKNKGGFEISEMEMQDIDNETDWKLAELKYKILFNK